MSEVGWTIDELAQRAADALAADAVHAPNGRVTAVPDRRLIRWYATIGLLDRPLRTRGRVARYGERHLLQLVAVKRRQAEGRSLAEIQAELAGATDGTLRAATGLPGSLPAAPAPASIDHDREGFWRATASAGPVPGPAGDRQPFSSPVRFHEALDPTITSQSSPPTGPPVAPVPLHPGATLVLYASPTPHDLAAIRAAAQPLLDLLADRGLLPERPQSRRPG